MNIQSMIDSVELARIKTANTEKVYFQDLKIAMIKRINEQWNSNNEIQGSFQNKYYNFNYSIENCNNRMCNRTIRFHSSGETLRGYTYMDIKNWLNTIL